MHANCACSYRTFPVFQWDWGSNVRRWLRALSRASVGVWYLFGDEGNHRHLFCKFRGAQLHVSGQLASTLAMAFFSPRGDGTT